MKSPTTLTRIAAAFGAALLLTLIAGTSLHAQIYQNIYGGREYDAARGGVQTVRNSPWGAGFVIVGESNSFGGGDYDIIVIRTDLAGRMIWGYAYDFGNYDFGRKIKETDDSSFVLTGITYNKRGCCTTDDIVMMKIDAYGNPVWAKTYGGSGYEEGMDLEVAKDPNGAGEVIYLTGYVTSFGSGAVDGFLMKTDNTGNVQWARTYGEAGKDLFFSMDVAANGDLIAAGYTGSYTNTGDIYVARVAEVDGLPIWVTFYDAGQEDVARSVIELNDRNSPFYGSIILAGYSNSFTFNGNIDALLVHLKPGGEFVTGRTVGDGVWGTNFEEFNEVVENPGNQLFRSGEISVIGNFENNPNGHGRYDMYMGEFSVRDCFPNFWQFVYGGRDYDFGYGIDIAPANPNTPWSLIGVGSTYSFQSWGNEEVYAVRANRGGKSGCNEKEAKTDDQCVSFRYDYVKPCTPIFYIQCDAKMEVYRGIDEKNLCISDGSIQPGTEPEKDAREFDNRLNPTGRNDRLEAAVTSAPNPVRKGASFDLGFTVSEKETASVVMTDITGKVIYSATEEKAGEHSLTVSTRGWSSGTYLMKVQVGDRTTIRRVIVLE